MQNHADIMALKTSAASYGFLDPPGAFWDLLGPPASYWGLLLGPPRVLSALLECPGACWATSPRAHGSAAVAKPLQYCVNQYLRPQRCPITALRSWQASMGASVPRNSSLGGGGPLGRPWGASSGALEAWGGEPLWSLGGVLGSLPGIFLGALGTKT